MTATGPLDTIRIVPDIGFILGTPDITLTNSQFTVEVPAIGSGSDIDTNVEKYVNLVCVTHLFEPVDESEKANRFFSEVSANQNLNLAGALTFNITINEYNSQLYDAFASRKAFFALITMDISGNPVHYSNTFCSA